MTSYIEIEWLCDDLIEARTITTDLINKRLVACVNITPSIVSIYPWKGKVETTQEIKVLMKTKEKHFIAIKEIIEQKCSYDIPVILSFKIEKLNASYQKWLEDTIS